MAVIDLTTPEAELEYRIKDMDKFIDRKKSAGDLDSITAKMETKLNEIKSDLDNPDLSAQDHIGKIRAVIRETKTERDESKADAVNKPEAQAPAHMKSTALDKIAETMANIALALARAFSKLVDFVFGTSLSQSPALNKTVKFGTAIAPAKEPQAKEEVKISQAKGKADDKETEKEPERDENHPDGRLSIKDVLRGHHSDSDLQKQQDELAKEGHRVFKVASNSMSQSQAVSR